jgi:hypothetical protein
MFVPDFVIRFKFDHGIGSFSLTPAIDALYGGRIKASVKMDSWQSIT